MSLNLHAETEDAHETSGSGTCSYEVGGHGANLNVRSPGR